MRNLLSTHAVPDVGEQYAEAVSALVEGLRPQRETTRKDRHGQLGFYVRLYAYAAPGTDEPVWAVDYFDETSRELEEYGRQDQAQARYEELVRESAENLDVDHEGAWERFTSTDVDGVPGPLPALPQLDFSQVRGLLEDLDQDAALYLERGDDGDEELVVRRGLRGQMPEPCVLLTRAQACRELGLGTGAVPDLEDPVRGLEMEELARAVTEQRVAAAADWLFRPART
ncbi:hypothetical protein [Streptomyces silvensis]|uniref:Uncharacterized protein n=1 Tax=Streptomyces silvensis TaxID=1765722 RepID=A0A0W7X3A3_9ACTN|nr:hypothetical protein [Streptomyces silvensis]KUF17373.1 hypothetical protein AT728_16360 [Streptomyces silvensis]